MEKNNAVVVFCVEGKSEIDALQDFFGSLFYNIPGGENITVQFRKADGDVSTYLEKGNNPKNDKRNEGTSEEALENEYKKIIYKRFFRKQDTKSEVKWHDVTHIIQIMDIDGAYMEVRKFTREEEELAKRINDANKEKEIKIHKNDPSIKLDWKEKRVLYFADHIAVKDEGKSSLENEKAATKRKRQWIETVRKWDEINYNKNTIHFSVYYFSSNLDHVLYEEANMASLIKTDKARTFSNKSNEELMKFFMNNECSAKEDYTGSWDKLWKGTVYRATNINLLIKRIQESTLEDWM